MHLVAEIVGMEGKMAEDPLVLNAPENLTDTRKMLANLTQKYLNGEIAEAQLRAATYAINGLGKLMLHEKSVELERRLAVLEKARMTK